MPTIFHTTLPDDADHDQILKDLNELVAEQAKVEMRSSARSGRGGKLGQVDPNVVEIIVHLLDTQAAAALVQSVTSGIVGYLFAKAGTRPRIEEKSEREKDG